MNTISSFLFFSFLLSFLSSIHGTNHLHAMQSLYIQLIFIQQIVTNYTNHSSTILFTYSIQSVIISRNHSVPTTIYQSLCIPTNNNGIYYKLQSFIHRLVIPVLSINSIVPATQNQLFYENGFNRIKHCVKPMK